MLVTVLVVLGTLCAQQRPPIVPGSYSIEKDVMVDMRDEKEWPLARTRFTPYYLLADGGLGTEPPSQAASSTSFEFDPRNPVPTIGGNISSGTGIMLQGAWDQKCSEQV